MLVNLLKGLKSTHFQWSLANKNTSQKSIMNFNLNIIFGNIRPMLLPPMYSKNEHNIHWESPTDVQNNLQQMKVATSLSIK